MKAVAVVVEVASFVDNPVYHICVCITDFDSSPLFPVFFNVPQICICMYYVHLVHLYSLLFLRGILSICPDRLLNTDKYKVSIKSTDY